MLPPTVHLLAASFLADAPADPTTGWLAYGPLGLMVAGFATGIIVPGHIYKQVLAENTRLHKLIDEKVYPTVEANAKATEQAIEALSARRPR
jgi:hypothetical protein